MGGNYTTEDGTPYPMLPDIECRWRLFVCLHLESAGLLDGHSPGVKDRRSSTFSTGTTHTACVCFTAVARRNARRIPLALVRDR